MNVQIPLFETFKTCSTELFQWRAMQMSIGQSMIMRLNFVVVLPINWVFVRGQMTANKFALFSYFFRL